MWRTAQTSEQKRAILDHLIPLTKDDYVDAIIAFVEDDDPSIRDAAFARLRSTEPNEIIRRLNASAPIGTIRAAMRYCVADPHPGIIGRLISLRRLSWDLVTELWFRPQEELWRTLVLSKGFVVLSIPQQAEVVSFLGRFSTALADQYREQVAWVTEKEIAAYTAPQPLAEKPPQEEPIVPAPPTPPPQETSDRVIIAGVDTLLEDDDTETDLEKIIAEGQTLDVSGALFDTGKGIVTEEEEVVDLETVELDVPDFMLTDKAFEGLSKEEIALNRKKIMEIINTLTMPQLVKLAMVGNMEVRRILIKDPRRTVAMAVLSNGGITPREIAALAGNPVTAQDVVEHIANNRTLSKNYIVKFALAMNPKTPVKLAMRFVEVLRRSDLKKLVENKNVSPLLRNMAKKRMI